MKSVIFPVALFLSVSALSQKTEDQKAIKSMCGCFEVKFDFAETFNYPKDTAAYKPSKVKHEYALEWVELVEDKPDKIILQHLLLVDTGMIVKHWRQDWLFENTNLYDYSGFNDWNFIKLPAEKVKGQWTQKVYEVDDKPRYEGSSTWVHVDGRHFWENTTHAPLPRREYTQRNDYNITRRTSVHEIMKSGWVHDQDNDKIIHDETGNEYLLAQEKGHNTYTRTEVAKCKAAQDWWKENKEFWAKVRAKWNKEFAKNKNIKLQDKIDGKPLYEHLGELKTTATREEVDKVINSFIISK